PPRPPLRFLVILGSSGRSIRVDTRTGRRGSGRGGRCAVARAQAGGEDGGGGMFPPVLVKVLYGLESQILADRVREESRRWLASCGLTVEQMQNQMDPVY
ncbi:hypothetical protein, partial [Escherichia coli]|uniref:hypothetical protein n=1 Tax=Escherichia coli TaxID=562 RepID=UPI0035B67383